MRNAMIEADQTVRGAEIPRGVELKEPVLV
jgi:hypothetical protein